MLQTGNAAASWVKETNPKPVSKLAYGNGPALKILKLQATVVATRELLQLSSLAAEDLFRTELLNAVAAAQDTAFIDPANAGTADAKPVSITNGVTAIVSTGTGDGDVEALMGAFAGDLGAAFFIANPKVAGAMSAQGAARFRACR